MQDGELQSDHRAQRLANDLRARDVEVVHQEHRVFDHLDAICGAVVRLARLAVTGQVELDNRVMQTDPDIGVSDMPRQVPVGGELVKEHYGGTLAVDDEVESHAVRDELLVSEPPGPVRLRDAWQLNEPTSQVPRTTV
jgi:hypothetical protein